MSYRSERDVKHYTPAQLMEIVEDSEDFDFFISGLRVNIRELGQAGWSCRIVKNRFGGRIKVAFTGKDEKSVMTFRLPSHFTLNPRIIFKALREGTFTVMPTNLSSLAWMDDQDLLNRVERNIKTRIKYATAGKRKPKTPVNEQRIQKVMGAA